MTESDKLAARIIRAELSRPVFTFDYAHTCATVRFADGREAFLQGDEACQLSDELEACETDRERDDILTGYSEVAQ